MADPAEKERFVGTSSMVFRPSITNVTITVLPKLRSLLLCFLVALLTLSCNEKLTDNPAANKRPSTYLWIFPDSSVGVGVSKQRLHWWGEDADGTVRGYLFAFAPQRTTRVPTPDTLRYVWVTKNDTLVQFPLDTLFRYYTVFVRAVDNSFAGLDSQRVIRLVPSAFADKNDNGVLDAGDRQLPTLPGALDPVGAVQSFPIRNSPPSIAFLPNPNDPSLALRQPEFTFTVAAFGFKGTDPDGENTLASYRIALNDSGSSAQWLTVPLRDTIVTLAVPRARSDNAGPRPGDTVTADVYSGKFLGRRLLGHLRGLRLDAVNVFYVQAKDVAGEFSPAIRMPSGAQQWFVKRPRAHLLLAGDYTRNDAATALSTYINSIRAIPGGGFAAIDTLNLASGVNAVDKQSGRLSTMVPPFIDPALILTFLLYDYVFLYTDEYPSIRVLQAAPFLYIQNGGKFLFSTFYSPDFSRFDITTVLKEFSPIDSVFSGVLPAATTVPGARLIPAGYRVIADVSVPGNIYPDLAFNASPPTHVFFMREAYKRTDGRVIYRLQQDTVGRYRSVDPSGGGDTLRPKVAIVDGQGKVIFFGLPLHLLDNSASGSGLTAFFNKALTGQFSARQQINRRKF